MSPEAENSAKAERQLASMYACLSSAHRLRAIALETGEARHYALAEDYFDRAEEIGRAAFDAVSFPVARYTIDARPYQEALLKLRDQAQRAPIFIEDVKRAIKCADDAEQSKQEIDEVW